MAGKVIKLDVGAVYQKTVNGTYFFRYQINGQRKAISLQTKNQKEALAKAGRNSPNSQGNKHRNHFSSYQTCTSSSSPKESAPAIESVGNLLCQPKQSNACDDE
eukprot:TRINITY_DN17186_c0_g1_i1.p2 TRINITY_DN17186_c0_g1~~TRINITY_DN17186_c0_g1_i1.p2  ORF type:complete len:104 (+),score=11.73 TRINITY_DN17186_c0_g1_i1:299-610(+)